MALTKNVLLNSCRHSLAFPRINPSRSQNHFLNASKSAMESGDDVLVSGFGKFCVKEKAERKGRNPSTGEDLMLKPRRVVTFKCSGKLREKINGG
jgi:integration host factor subunit alpha